MSKIDFEVAVAFATQSAEGTYDPTLDAITDTLTYTDGLLLGDPESGVRESGLSLTFGRKKKDKAFLGATFTRPLSDFLLAEVPTLSFAMPFCGNRKTQSGAPADSDGTPIAGLDALLEAAGLTGAAWGSGVGWQYIYGSTNPISGLIYYSGERVELLDCRAQLSIAFTAGEVPVLTATVEVGSIKDHSLAAIPGTLTWGPGAGEGQAERSAPKTLGAGFTWRDGPARGGFSEGTLNLTPAYTDIGDCNAATGLVKEQEDRETSFEATIFSDDTTDDGHEYEQLTTESQAVLDQMSFLVGTAMADGEPVEAVGIIMDDPEPETIEVTNLGTKRAYNAKLVGRGTSAGNNEIEINFQ